MMRNILTPWTTNSREPFKKHDMYHFVFQSDAKMAVFQSDASDCVPKWSCYRL